ncbi:hypothetical protein BYT27DRAFT_7264029 [Phlegmacium glaucopus]|nr:hypothetical protein BYT27DRAFT_7264029 [Phlegmacium glaucopus]
MEMITTEVKERFQDEMRVEYRVDKQAVKKKPATELSWREMEDLLFQEQYLMELLLLYEVKEWEQRFWNKLKAFLDQLANDRMEERERLTREWRADCWKRLNPQMHAAEKRLADLGKNNYQDYTREKVHTVWASYIGLFEGVETPNSEVLSEIQLRMENEIEDTEFRLKRGSELGRFDQFWDDDILFDCRYSRSKWFCLDKSDTIVPLEIYSHALKGNKNIIHINFDGFDPDFDVNWIHATICDLPWVTSISRGSSECLPAIHRDRLFIKSTNNDLITFAKEIRLKLDSFTYIFTDADSYDTYSAVGLRGDAKVLISFVAPTSGQSLVLRLKHSGKGDGLPIEVTLGSTKIQLNSSSKSSLTIDDITLHPISGFSESNHISFQPGDPE